MAVSSSPFLRACRVGTPGAPRNNHFALFTKSIPCLPATTARLRVWASYHYELHVNGQFLGRGPVHGDPAWRFYDEYTFVAGPEDRVLDVALLVHHSTGTHLHYQIPGPPGLAAEVEFEGQIYGTGPTWKCRTLEMWADGTPERNWALDYCEDYDAEREPDGWLYRRFPATVTADWPNATALSEDAPVNWAPRPVPRSDSHHTAEPIRFWSWRTSRVGATAIKETSRVADEEILEAVTASEVFTLDAVVAAQAAGANAFTFDLGREWIGHPSVLLEAPAAVTVELSSAELLQPDTNRPWVYRKGTPYTARYRTREGLQRLRWFAWTGGRYLHVVLRGAAETSQVRFRQIGVERRAAALGWRGTNLAVNDADLGRVLDICRHTLEQCAVEHLIDCPTREQTQYWGDAVFTSQSYARAFDEPAYRRWYLDGFLRAPLRPDGQLSSTYPGYHTVLIDYSLIPLIGQVYYKRDTGAYYRAEETTEKALRLKEWYDRHAGGDGLVTFDFADYMKQGLINFIDHPGIGWHDFPHPGIDREGTSCPLNTFFYGFLRILADLCRDSGRVDDAAKLGLQADRLAETLRRTFWNESTGLYHDAVKDGTLSEGASWHTNCLMVFFDLVSGERATALLRTMLDGYDRLCRCSPYFHFYLLPSLRKAGMEREAIELIKREWRPMLEAGATTAWEGFLGDAKDSLCHPWSTAPLLYLLDEPFRTPGHGSE